MPFPPDEIYRHSSVALVLLRFSRANPDWAKVISGRSTRELVAQVEQIPKSSEIDVSSAQSDLASLEFDASHESLARVVKGAHALGLARLPTGWALASGPHYRSAIGNTLRSFSFEDLAGWPSVSSCREFYATAADPASRVMIASVPVARSGTLLVGNFLAFCGLRIAADVVISLCRTGVTDAPPEAEHHEFWLNDSTDFIQGSTGREVLEAAAEATARALDDGRTVLLHCAVGRSRSPLVAALAISRLEGTRLESALERVRSFVPESVPLSYS